MMLMLNILQCTPSHPQQRIIWPKLSGVEIERLYSRAPLPLILIQRIGTNSISCLSTDKKKMKSMSITVIYDYLPGYPPKMQPTGACSERDCDGSQATANCLSLVVILLSGSFSAFLFLLFDESALSLESLTYTVVTALLFTEWAWVCGRQNRGSKDVNILIPGMRECVTLPGQERITDVIKSRILRWDSPRLSK